MGAKGITPPFFLKLNYVLPNHKMLKTPLITEG